MISVISAEYISGYTIKVKFDDAFEGVADFKDKLLSDRRKIVSELQSLEKFKDFAIKANTIVWKNGLDFAPEYIRSLCVLLPDDSQKSELSV